MRTDCGLAVIGFGSLASGVPREDSARTRSAGGAVARSIAYAVRVFKFEVDQKPSLAAATFNLKLASVTLNRDDLVECEVEGLCSAPNSSRICSIRNHTSQFTVS